ncbi:Alpha/Beta hydrolase protein [Mortierella sp. GBAus27b]|nr:Alpha/Beta hydrolase protein [Mortierella sp. GBAus27b]
MIPAAFVNMDAFPLNANGKLDRRSLPVPNDNDFAREGYVPPQGRIESSLSFIWEDVLSISKVGRHDDFFAIGGHSLLALKMISRVRHLMGFEMSIRTVFEAPTIAKLALRLSMSGTTQQEDSYHVLLPIKPNGSWAPLFCFPPLLGLSWCFLGLSKHLPPEQPLYGLQARGFYGEEGLDSTLDEMALGFIDQIRRIQPHGPYHLLGFSFGGAVAHLVASHLSKQGERIELVAWMDVHPINNTQTPPPEDEDEDSDKEEDHIFDLLRGSHGDAIPDHAKAFVKRASLVVQNNRQLLDTCALPVISTNVVLFRATEALNPDVPLLNPDKWKPYVLGEIESHDIHCTHKDMVEPEHLETIGQILTRKLNELHTSL